MLNVKPKIYFLGNGLFAAAVIEELAEQKFQLDGVLSLTDKKVGRGQKNLALPVKLAINKTNYHFFEFSSKEEFSLILETIEADYLIVADFGWIISDQNLQMIKKAAINIHPSLLPKYRGPSPIQSAILAGDQSTGVTLMKMDEEVDHGPIIAQESVKISPDETAKSLISKTATIGAKLLIKNLPKYLEGFLVPVDQDHQSATFTQIIKKTDGLIDWKKSAVDIDRQVRALSLWPKAFTTFRNKYLIIHAGRIDNGEYVPTQVQFEGRKIIFWADFLNGQRLKKSEALKELTDKNKEGYTDSWIKN